MLRVSEHPAITDEAGRLPAPVNPPGVRNGAAPTIRTAVRAIVVRDGRLLVTVNENDSGRFLLIPGGGQDWGESAVEALAREVREEVGCEVVVGDLVCVRDYLPARLGPAGAPEAWFHQQELFFACALAEGSEPAHVGRHERWQRGIAWVELAGILEAPLWPRALRRWLLADPATRPVYLGAVS